MTTYYQQRVSPLEGVEILSGNAVCFAQSLGGRRYVYISNFGRISRWCFTKAALGLSNLLITSGVTSKA